MLQKLNRLSEESMGLQVKCDCLEVLQLACDETCCPMLPVRHLCQLIVSDRDAVQSLQFSVERMHHLITA